MRRFNLALAGAIAVAVTGTAAQADQPVARPAPAAAKAPAAAPAAPSKRPVRRLKRAGTPTAAADSFFPVAGQMFTMFATTTSMAAAAEVRTFTASPE